MTNIPQFLFVLLILMAVFVLGIGVISEVPGGQGFSHPSFRENTLQQAPDGLVRHRSVIWLGGGFGLFSALLMVVCMLLGLNRQSQGAVQVFYVLGGVYGVLIAGAVIIYWWWIGQAGVKFVLGFPIPTAYVLFIVGFFPLIFVFLYVAKFDQWIFTAADQGKFEKLVKARRKNRVD